jgi:uncharacterized protein (DUF1800 family)
MSILSRTRLRLWLTVSLLVALTCGASLLAEKKKKAAEMDETKRAVHALNRLTFGPRPGDIEAVKKTGVEKWIDRQLDPDKIDDSALEARLAPFRTLKMDTREMVENFPPPQVLKAINEGKMSMPSDPKKRAVYEAQLTAYRDRLQAKKDGNNGNVADAQPNDNDDSPDRRAMRQDARRTAEDLLDRPANDRFNAVLKMPAEQRRMAVTALNEEARQKFLDGMTPEQREQLMAMARPQFIVNNELSSAKLLRAIYSERQLEEVMTDFWYNHFNIFIGKGADRYMITAYERDVIRKHAMGNFKDLLLATAESPAMQFYLDNWQSIGPNSRAGEFSGRGGRQNQNRNPFGRNNRSLANGRNRGGFNTGSFDRDGIATGPRRSSNSTAATNPDTNDPNMAEGAPMPQQNRPKRGLNENYARELMELHTLGVDGGYTQQDVIEVAKIFSGWTIKEPRRGGGFEFDERRHEPGTKIVLGQKISEDGMNEGKKVLELLSKSPATARFISKKLAMRFVSDDPPPALVARMADKFLSSNGNIEDVLRVMFKSPEFWAPEAYRAKVKTPLEFVVSAVRATGADVSNVQPLIGTLNRLGMPLYGMQPPTGYSMKADAWVNSAALLNRMNFALQLGSGKMRGVTIDQQRALNDQPLPQDPDSAFAVVANALLAGDVSQQTRDVIRKQMDDPANNAGAMQDNGERQINSGLIAGLVLGSPEFQRR